MDFEGKYLKYKNKYLVLKNQTGGFNYNIGHLNNPVTVSMIKEKLKQRHKEGLQNWLVLYAKYYTVNEQLRFNNPNWIFCDREISLENRLTFQIDITFENLQKLSTLFPGLFDYITTDWGFSALSENTEQICNFIFPWGFTLLSKGGCLAFNKKSIPTITEEIIIPTEQDDFSITSTCGEIVPYKSSCGGDIRFLHLLVYMLEYNKLKYFEETRLKEIILNIYNKETLENIEIDLKCCGNTMCLVHKLCVKGCNCDDANIRYIDNVEELNSHKINQEIDNIISQISNDWVVPCSKPSIGNEEIIILQKK
jgi:hypothetical protein